MTWHLRQMRELLRRFAKGQRATAAIEFALVFPIMLALYVGAVEGGALITVDRKVQSVAGAVGDLVARSNENIPVNRLTDYFRAAGGIMTPYTSTPLVQRVTLVEVRPDLTTRVDWCRQYANGVMTTCTIYPAQSSFTLPEDLVNLARNQYVVVSEASYSYTPIARLVITQPVNLFRRNFYMPRFGGNIRIQ